MENAVHPCLTTPPPSARLVPPRAQAAPTPPGAPPGQLGSLLSPQDHEIWTRRTHLPASRHAGGVDYHTEILTLLDEAHRPVGHLGVSVRAIDALRAVQAAGLAPTPGAAPARRRRRGGAGSPVPERGEVAAETKTLQVVVPPGTRPGASLQVDAGGGSLYDVVVPEGVRPGESMTITVPAPPKDEKLARRRRAGSEAGRPGEKPGEPSPGRRHKQPSEADRRAAHSKQYSDNLRQKQLADREARRRREAAAQRRAPSASAGAPPPPPEDSAAAIIQRRFRTGSPRTTPGAPPPPPLGGPPPPLPASRQDSYVSMRSASSRPSTAPGAGAAAPPPPSGLPPGLPPGTAPTEVEHTLLVAFERLGTAHAQLLQQQERAAALERQLSWFELPSALF